MKVDSVLMVKNKKTKKRYTMCGTNNRRSIAAPQSNNSGNGEVRTEEKYGCNLF